MRLIAIALLSVIMVAVFIPTDSFALNTDICPTNNPNCNDNDDDSDSENGGGGEGNNTGCSGQGNPNSPCGNGGNGGGGGNGGNGGSGGSGGSGGDGTGVGVGVGIGIGGGADVDVNNDNTNVAVAGGGDATATGGNATGGEGGDASIYIGGGEEGEGGAFSNDNDIDNSSSSTTGDQNTNVTVNVGEDGPLTASTQSVDANATVAEGAVQIDNSNNSVYKESVRTAATSFSSVCTSGAAAQGNSYGLSVAVTSTQCSYLMQADAYMAMGKVDEAMKYVDKAGRATSIKGFMSTFRTIITLGIL